MSSARSHAMTIEKNKKVLRLYYIITRVMGGSVSKTTVNNLSSSISNVASSIVQSCVVTATQSQDITVNNSGLKLFGNYKLTQQTDISSTCFSDTNKQTQLQNQIINTISQATSSNSIALLGAFGTSTALATANLTNIVRNNVTMKNIQQSYNMIKQSQTASFTNSGVIAFEQAALTQGAQIFAAATLKAVETAGIFNTVSNYVDQKAAATQTSPFQFIVDAISAIGSAITENVFLFIFIIAAVLLGGGYFVMKLGQSGVLEQIPLPPQAQAGKMLSKI